MVEWFTPQGADGVLANLASGSQIAILDRAVKDAVSNTPYVGTMVSIRLNVSIYLNATFKPGLFLVGLVLPNAATVPTVASEISRKNAEKWVWFVAVPTVRDATNGYGEVSVSITTGRRLAANDRLVLVMVNQTGAAAGAAAVTWSTVDAYIRLPGE